MKEIVAVIVGCFIGFWAHCVFIKPLNIVSSDGLNECYATVDNLNTRLKIRDSLLRDYAIRDGKEIVKDGVK